MTPRVLVLAGPTGAGKTEASLAVAKAFDATVLSADAMQVYRGFDIGTAKASAAERALVPHEGLDVRDPTEAFDAADFAALGDELLAQGRRVVVAGGTHLYIQALVRGLVPTPAVDITLRAELSRLPDPHGDLARVDPTLAARLHPNDLVRVVRGLEVYRATGERLSDLQAQHAAMPDRVQAAGLWLDREPLRPRLGERLSAMVEQGYLDEVRGLLAAGVPPTCKPMRSLGYRHMAAHLAGDIDLAEAVRLTERDTWVLARKQRNWRAILALPQVVGGPDAVSAALAVAKELWPMGSGPR